MPAEQRHGMDAQGQDGGEGTRGGWRAARLLLLGALPVAIVLALMLLQVAGAKRDYLLERSHRDLRLASRQIASRLDGLGAQCELGKRDTWLGATTLQFLDDCPSDATLGAPLLELHGARFYVGSAAPVAGRLVVRCTDRQGNARCGHRPLRELLPDRSAFDEMLVTRAGGSVLVQADGARGTIAELDDLPAPSTEGGRASQGLLPWLTFGSTEAAPAPPRGRWVGLHHAADVILAGETMKLFCEAVRPPPPVSTTDLVVCGLRPTPALSAEAWEVPAGFLAAVLTLLAATLCSWPALKLRLMGPTERLRASDVRWLVLSCLAGVGLATFVVVDLSAVRDLRNRLDHEQEALATALASQLEQELATAAKQLRAFRGRLEALGMPPGALDRATVESLCAGLGKATYSRLSDLAFIAPWGVPVAACAIDDASGRLEWSPHPTRSVEDRRYFRDVQDGRLWWLAGEEGLAVALEPVRTRSTGAPAVVLAQRVGVPGDGPAGVVLLAARLRSAIDPALPAGLGFAVVEPDGLVALHSRSDRNLEENLFDECDRSPALRAAVEVRQPQVLRSHCYGRDVHRLVTRPLPNTPWTVVTFRNVEPAGLMNLGVIDLWACAFLSYLVVVAVSLGLVAALRPRFRLDWLWPTGAHARAYWQLAGTVLVIVAVGFAWSTVFDGWARLATVVAVPIAAMATARRVLRRPGGQAGAAAARSLAAARPGYVALLAALALALGSMPAYATFLAAWSLGTEAFVKRAQLDFLGALERRVRDSRERPTPAFTEPWSLTYESSLLGGVRHRDDTAAGPEAAPPDAAADQADGLRRHPLAAFLRALPGPAETLSWFEVLASDGVGDHRLRWFHGPGSTLRLDVHDRRLLAALHEPGALSLVAEVPSHGIPAALWQSPDALAGVVVLLLALLGLMYAVIGRLFLLGEGEEPASVAHVWVHAPPAGQDAERLLAERSAVPPVDLARSPSAEVLGRALREARGLVVLDHLEDRLADSGTADVLPVLEAASAAGPVRLVLVSEIDPIAFLSTQFAASETAPGTEARATVDRFWRWTRLLGGCTRLVLEPGSAAGATGTLGDVVTAKRGRLPAPASATDEDYWRIWAHCTKAEKLAMAHLAQEGFLNPHATPVLRNLLERGLVRRAPAFELFSPMFREFVVAAEAPGDLRTWERESEKDWARAQLPLVGALAMAAGFLFLTQPHLFSTGTGMATAAAGALGGAVQLLRLVASRERSGTGVA